MCSFLYYNSLRETIRLAQTVLHASHADASGGFGSSRTPPVSFETDRVVIAVTLQRFELPNPIHTALPYRSPSVLAVRFVNSTFAMAVPDAVLWQQIVTIRIGPFFSGREGVARVPVQHEMRRWNRSKHLGRFRSSGSVTAHFIFQDEEQVLFAQGFGRAGAIYH